MCARCTVGLLPCAHGRISKKAADWLARRAVEQGLFRDVDAELHSGKGTHFDAEAQGPDPIAEVGRVCSNVCGGVCTHHSRAT